MLAGSSQEIPGGSSPSEMSQACLAWWKLPLWWDAFSIHWCSVLLDEAQSFQLQHRFVLTALWFP